MWSIRHKDVNTYIYQKVLEYIGGHKRLKNINTVYIMRLIPSKVYKIFPLAHKWSILAKHGACWPYHNEQRCFPNAERVGPWFVAPQLHEATSMAGDPRSRPWELHKWAQWGFSPPISKLPHPLRLEVPLLLLLVQWLLLVFPVVEDDVWSSRSLSDALIPHLYITYIVVRYSSTHKKWYI